MKLSKKFWLRAAAVAFLILLGVVMFFVGRQHSILVDNKAIEIDGVSYKALDVCEVSIDGGDPEELVPRDRIQVDVMDQHHTLVVSYTDANWDEKKIKIRFTTPVKEEMMVLSIPAVVAGLPMDKCLTHFESQAVTVDQIEQGETIQVDETTSFDI
jgi:hypothetical protein